MPLAHYLSPFSGPLAAADPMSRLTPNNGGGLAFAISKWQRLNRFLIMGVEGGTYYVGQKELALQNAKCLLECILSDGLRTVREIVKVSDEGRAIKNSPAIFALAVCAANGDNPTMRSMALDCLPKVCRTGTHLFEFCQYVRKFRGWGRGLKRAVANWYLLNADLNGLRDLDNVAYQLLKYQQREGWSHRDLLRLSHPMPTSGNVSTLFKYVVTGEAVEGKTYPDIVCAFEEAKTATKERLIQLIYAMACRARWFRPSISRTRTS